MFLVPRSPCARQAPASMSCFAQRPTASAQGRGMAASLLTRPLARPIFGPRANATRGPLPASLPGRVPPLLGNCRRWLGDATPRKAAEVPRDAQEPAEGPDSDQPAPGPWARFKNFVLGGKLDKERIRALGIGAVLSYGFVSNVTYGACVVVAWITHVRRTGLTPFAPGQWAGFLGVYAGLFALQNLLRPLRFTVAVALTPFVDRLMGLLQRRMSVSKGQAFGILMVCLGLFTTSSLTFFIWLFGGIPSLPSPLSAV